MDITIVEDAIKDALAADETIAAYLKEAFILPTTDLDILETLTNPTPAFGAMYVGGGIARPWGP